jgi:molybdopterin-containing oxidoreductase family iron-sulfur binding subunit
MKQENQNIWVSVEDLNNEPEFVERSKQEFFELPVVDAMSSDENVIEEATRNSNRRDFLKYMGFGLTAATIAASCEIPVRKAIPYVVKPDAIVPGVATYYASTFIKGGDVCPIVVKTREGRPIKIEGNTMSSMTRGGTSARVQASILELYDTARIRKAGINKKGKIKDISWDKLDSKIKEVLTSDSNIRIVTNTIVSPSIKAAIEDFKAVYTNTEVVTYDPVSVSGLLDANEESFGQRVVPDYDFSKAKVVATFGADFLGTWISPIEYAAAFTVSRKADENMMRLYALESGMSLTGSNADHRIFIKPSEQGQAVIALYNEIAEVMGEVSISVQKLSHEKSNSAIKEMAKDLLEAEGSIVISDSNDKYVQVVVNKINDLLGNYGNTINFKNYSNQRQGDDKLVKKLTDDMNAGRVDVVIINDANPIYDAPNASEFAKAIKKVKTVISCDSWYTETSEFANYLAPQTHFLESWGDAEPKRGQFSVIQPTISPLHENRQFIESLLVWAGSETVTAYDYVKSIWSSTALEEALDKSTAWDNALHDGFVIKDTEELDLVFEGDAISAGNKIERAVSSGVEINFYESVNIGGGQYANNPWLQEMPDPINRTVWDNVLMIPVSWSSDKGNYANAEGFEGLKDGDRVELKIGENLFDTVVVRQFGQMPGTVSIALGYGRTEGGRVAKGVGNNVSSTLLTYKNGSRKYFATNVSISGKKGEDKDFACVQMHHTMGVYDKSNPAVNVDEQLFAFQGSLTKRSIIRTANLSELESKVEELKHEREHHQKLNNYSLYDGHDYSYEQGHHWGMNVDLSACIGCGACQVACVAENNVPMVGKHEVSIHHEMTWIRIDRYFYGDVENPNVVYQPMMCQHCDNAPCENVCPVAATNHSSEGLNQMTYNRCIGTRYCANNCPYKVRRFNWLDYTTADLFAWNEPGMGIGGETPYYADNLTRMVLNPDVTVRSRGVIEKCSFCVQRIQEAKLTAKIEKRILRDGDLKVACQTACPTGAITFGDMNDKNSAISRELAADRTYKVLEEVNTASSVGYQVKVLNKNNSIG